MARNQRYYDPKDRLRILKEFEASGIGVMEFCEKSGIAYDTFRSWRKKHAKGEPLDTHKKQGPVDPRKRLQAVEAFHKSGMTLENFARTYGVSTSSITVWVRVHRERGPKGLENPSLKVGAQKRGPKGIPKAVREQIVEVKRENPSFGLRKVKSFLNRFRGVDAAVGTINKAIKEERLDVPQPRRRRRRSSEKPRGFERAKSMQLWQTDITYFTLTKHQQRCYLTVFLDDHSRYIVGWRLGLRQTGEFVMEALLDGIQRFGRPQEILSDQGRQYFAWRGKTEFQNLLRKQGIQHVVARSHHPQTVGKCERLWKTIKDELWERAGPMDLEEAQERLQHYINHYNHFRPNQGIDNLVPADRFFGAESEVRAAIEKNLSDNEIRLATGERPQAPTFLVGQIGGKAISMHGEKGRLVLNLPGQPRNEINYKTIELGEEHAGHELEAGETQEKEKAEGATEICTAGENALGFSDAGAEDEGAGIGDGNPGILDGLHHEAGGLEEAECAAGQDLAAVTASDIGYASGVTGAAQDEGERNPNESERRSESSAEENQRDGRDDQAAGHADHDSAFDAGVPGRDDPGSDQGEGRG